MRRPQFNPYRALKCPFCTEDMAITFIDNDEGCCYVECESCAARGPRRKSPDWAAESWNRVAAIMSGNREGVHLPVKPEPKCAKRTGLVDGGDGACIECDSDGSECQLS